MGEDCWGRKQTKRNVVDFQINNKNYTKIYLKKCIQKVIQKVTKKNLII